MAEAVPIQDEFARQPASLRETLRALRDYASLDPAAAERTNLGVDIALGITPGLGTAMAGRDFERARREGSPFGMGLAALGVVPIAGKPVAAAAKGLSKAAKAAMKKAEALRYIKSIEDLPPELSQFGRKGEREAATKAKLAKQQQSDAVIEKQKGAGTREKIPATYFRDKLANEGEAEVMAAALRGEHLKPLPGGGYVGAPRTVQTGRQLGAMRNMMDEQLRQGADALRYADPERVGDWYTRAKAGQLATTEPYQLPRTLEGTAVYSAGVSPEAETAFNVKHGLSRALGTNEKAYRQAGANTLDRAVAADKPAKLAPKIGEYRGKNDPSIVETSPFGVNDFRRAQGLGYTDPTGAPWKAGVSETMHPFIDAETALQVRRANAAGTGGKTDWTGATIQEVPWVYDKAQDLYARGYKGRYKGGTEGMVKALRDANMTMADYVPKHTLSSTMEYVPGKNTGHVPGVADLPFEERKAYGDIGRWDQPSPEQPLFAGDTRLDTPLGRMGEGNRDVLYGAAGFRQSPAVESLGNYRNSAGQIENNPMTIARPLVDFQTGTQQAINPPTQKSIDAIETLRGVIDAQEAAAGNLPVTMAGRKGKTSILFEGASPESLKDLGKYGDVTATDRGVLLMDPKNQRAILKAEALRNPQKAGFEGTYQPAMSTAEEAGQGIATTRALEAMAAAPEAVAMNVGESEAVRKAIRDKVARDAAIPGARPDIEKTRRFFSEADWPKAVAMMRKGMKPAAALAALGYSIQGMADEPDLQMDSNTMARVNALRGR